MTGQTEDDIPETGAIFTFGKSKFADNVPSKFWLKNDHPEEISCGGDHTALVTGHSRLFMFGSNTCGQLGLGSEININKPTAVKVLKTEKVKFAACGRDHTIVCTWSGQVYGAGSNQEGQLGLGHCDDTNTFHLIHPFSDHAPIKMLAAGCNTSAALTEEGRLFMWGDNSVGQIGLGAESYASEPREVMVGQSVAWVSCGYHHSAFVTVDGDLYTFGESRNGRLGLFHDQLANHRVPQQVEGIQDPVIQVSCGGEHTVALTKEDVYTFGRGQHGQLGHGTFLFEAHLPKALVHFRNGRVSHVTCGENHTAVITDSGILYTFGDGRHGKLGLGEENFTNQFRPTLCPRFLKYSVQSVKGGSSHMLVLAIPRPPEVEEVVIEEDDVTETILETLETYTELLMMDPSLLMSNPPTAPPLWTLSARARRRERECSPEQFGQMFRNLPPLMSGFFNTSLPVSRNIHISRTPCKDPSTSSLSSNPSSNNTPIPSLSLKPRSKPPLTPSRSPQFTFPDPPSPSLSSKSSPKKKKPTPSKSPKSTSKEPSSPSQSFLSMPKLIPDPTLSPKTPFKKPTDYNQSPKTLSKGHPSPSRSPTSPQTDRNEDTVTEAPDSLMLIENMEDVKDTLSNLASLSRGDSGNETGTTSAEQKDKGHKKGRVLWRAVKEAERKVEQTLTNRKEELPSHEALPTELQRGSSLNLLKAEAMPTKSPKPLKTPQTPQTPARGKENITLTTEKAGLKVKTSKLESNLQSTGKAGSKLNRPARKQSKLSVLKPSTPKHSQIQISVSKPSTPKHGQSKLSEVNKGTEMKGKGPVKIRSKEAEATSTPIKTKSLESKGKKSKIAEEDTKTIEVQNKPLQGVKSAPVKVKGKQLEVISTPVKSNIQEAKSSTVKVKGKPVEKEPIPSKTVAESTPFNVKRIPQEVVDKTCGGKSTPLNVKRVPQQVVDKTCGGKSTPFNVKRVPQEVVDKTCGGKSTPFNVKRVPQEVVDKTSEGKSTPIKGQRKAKEVNEQKTGESITFKESGTTEGKEMAVKDKGKVTKTKSASTKTKHVPESEEVKAKLTELNGIHSVKLKPTNLSQPILVEPTSKATSPSESLSLSDAMPQNAWDKKSAKYELRESLAVSQVKDRVAVPGEDTIGESQEGEPGWGGFLSDAASLLPAVGVAGVAMGALSEAVTSVRAFQSESDTATSIPPRRCSRVERFTKQSAITQPSASSSSTSDPSAVAQRNRTSICISVLRNSDQEAGSGSSEKNPDTTEDASDRSGGQAEVDDDENTSRGQRSEDEDDEHEDFTKRQGEEDDRSSEGLEEEEEEEDDRSSKGLEEEEEEEDDRSSEGLEEEEEEEDDRSSKGLEESSEQNEGGEAEDSDSVASREGEEDREERSEESQGAEGEESKESDSEGTGEGEESKESDSQGTGEGEESKESDSVGTGEGEESKESDSVGTGEGEESRESDSEGTGVGEESKESDSL
uniref:mucin-17-like n=1 Tax=Oncorhynchus gorbuscha TaxID=8017 RepID=UPI001EAF23A9|nr:mucin-17-like [Oncorhynchus gorbuscha]